MATALKSTPARSTPPRKQRVRSGQRSHLQAVQSSPQLPPTRRSHPLPSNTVSHTAPTRLEAPPGIHKLPTRRPIPIWLRLLIHLQRGSVVVAFVLVTAALVVYGSTIYMQQHWSKGYNKLKSMQRSERQMIAAEGLMKNQLIQQAEQPGSGLVPRTSDHTIVLEPAPERVPVTANPVLPNPVLKVEPSTQSEPLGY
ncbi:MAG: hypothetical protein NW224_20290 [Leptolyngbyaceae cyanobacterium bins.302]|nr:hypothetical protein [Leptolyngbyaceae cyanobacterium bins.302]